MASENRYKMIDEWKIALSFSLHSHVSGEIENDEMDRPVARPNKLAVL